MAAAELVGDIPNLQPGAEVNAPAAVPPLPPRQRLNPGLQLIRSPPILKLTMDLDTYLRRFEAYTNSIGATPAEIPNLFINCLDDETLQYIERHLVDNITLNELLAVLRREMGIGRANREDFKAKLRKTLRGRNEDVRSFYAKLWTLAKKAWPDNVEVRDSNLRDSFIANIQDSLISARLRERGELNNENLLDLASTLLSCKNASLSRQSEVNATFGLPTAHDEALNVEPPARSLPAQSLENKLDQVIEMLACRGTQGQSNTTPYPPPAHDNDYYYTADDEPISPGLDDFETDYNGPITYPDQELDTPLDWTVPTWY